MTFRFVVGALLLGCSTPALAQQSGDLVMRRPIPFSAVKSEADSCQPGQNCNTQRQDVYIAFLDSCSADGSSSAISCRRVTMARPYETAQPEDAGAADVSLCAAQDPSSEAYRSAAVLMLEPAIAPADISAHPSSCGPTTIDPGPGTGFQHDPDKIEKHPDDGRQAYFYVWTTGSWEGAAQCGKQSTLTRTVSCVGAAPSGGEIGGEWPGEGPVRAMSAFQNGDALSVSVQSAIAENPVTLTKAQMGPIGPQFEFFPTDPANCVAQAGPPPATTYVGKGAGCTYELQQGEWSEWTNPFGSATCSRSASRQRAYTCVGPDGKTELEYCVNDLRAGGVEDYSKLNGQYQYGNFSGCTAQWREEPEYLGCQGSAEQERVYYSCYREDGQYMSGVDEAACGPLESLQGQTRTIGPCFKGRYVNAGSCDGDYLGKIMDLPNSIGSPSSGTSGAYYWAGSDACTASCCAMMFNYDRKVFELGAFSGSFTTQSRSTYYNKMLYGMMYATLPADWIPSRNRQ